MQTDTLKRLGRKLLTPFLGKKRYQPFFQLLYEVSLAGLNVGEGANPYTSGEIYMLHYLKNRISMSTNPIIVFDVGANVGQFALTTMGALGQKAQIYAFEPSPKTYKQLQFKVSPYQNVKTQNIGLGDREDVTTLFSLGEGSKLASVYNRQLEHKGTKMAYQEEIKITTLDKFCSQEGITHIDLLKLDVEGHELKVLQGATDMLQKKAIRFIQFEFSAAHIDAKVFFRDFFNLLSGQYQIYRILQDGLWPIHIYSESHELFKRATNYLAERI